MNLTDLFQKYDDLFPDASACFPIISPELTKKNGTAVLIVISSHTGLV